MLYINHQASDTFDHNYKVEARSSTKMKCTHESCGADIPAGARFCTGCGTEVQAPVSVKTTLCPSCNSTVVKGCKFCQSCGGKIDPALFIDRICHGTKDNGQKCNTVLTSGTKFCPSCGTLQDASNTHDTSSKDDFPGDGALKLSLKTTQQKEDNQDKTTPPIKEEHGSSGSSSPDLWEAPTIPLQSNANKTEPVKEIVQQVGSHMNPAQIALIVPRNAADGQDVKTLETGQDCPPKKDNEGLKLTNQQSGAPQGSGQASPVDKESPGLLDHQTGELQNSCHTGPVDEESPELTNQQTGEPHNSSHTGPVDKEIPGVTDQQTGELQNSCHTGPVDEESPELTNQQTGEPHNSSHTGPVDKGIPGVTDQQTDQQTGELQNISHTGPVDEESPVLLDQVIDKPQDNEPIVPDNKDVTGLGNQSGGSYVNAPAGTVEKKSPDLADKKTVEPEDNGLSGPIDNGDQGLTDKKISESQAENVESDSDKRGLTTEVVTTETDTLKSATAEEMDVSETKHETNDLVQIESEITNMETQTRQSNHNDSNGNRNSEKPSNATEIDDQITKLQGGESEHNESDRDKQEQNEKDIIEDPSNKDDDKPETKDDTTDSELQVILISDTESVEDGQDRNEELVNTNVKPTKRKLEEEEGQIKKIKGGDEKENSNCDKGVQQTNTQSDEKHGIQETGEQGNADRNVGQNGQSTAEQGENTKDGQDTEDTNKNPTDDQLVKQKEDTDEEKRLKENHNQEEDQLPSMRITRSMQASKNGDQSNQNKKELPKKNGTNSRTDQKPSERTDTLSFGLTHFTIHFHAIMHASIFDESCKAIVRFSSDNLGGWKSNRHELFALTKYNNGNIEVEGTVSVPRGFIEKGIQYRYFIVCGNDEQQEFVFNQKDNLRYFYVTTKQLKSFNDVFHQYDGVIRGFEVKEGFTNYIKYLTGYETSQYKKQLLEDARQSACVFLPKWQTTSLSSGLTGEDMIMRIAVLNRGLHYCYCRNTYALTEQDLKSLFSEAIRSGLDTLWKEFISKKEFSEENRMKVFMNAVTVAYLFKEYAFPLSTDEKSALSVALLPEKDMSGQNICIENLKEVFPQSFQKIQWALINVVDYDMSLSWLCCMPLIHFLVNQCYPGEKPNEDTQHDYGRPYWWGIADKDNYWMKLDVFKEKIVEKECLIDMLERLVPYFEMDYLLPRALMASLNLEQLPEVVRTGHISTDIILASVCYYVREEKNISKNDRKETAIIECLTVVKSKFCEENIEISVDNLMCAWRSFMIAADVLKSIKDRKNKLTDNVKILALDAFLISLHVYCTVNDSLQESADKPASLWSYDTKFNSVQYSIRSWLKDKINQSKNNELLACLKSWDRILNVPVPPGLIRNQFTKFIAESLHDSLKSKSFDEELVKVYCQNQSTFCEAMLEVLTNYAFDAVCQLVAGHVKYREMEGRTVKNFGKLLFQTLSLKSIFTSRNLPKNLTSVFTVCANLETLSQLYIK
ncbi:Hypothetical predicted protein [Mytilus galloprovincialis]|uniref:Rhodanese domain-containing protein n=1 Tax=Mytilus galloprovincialis TaxID=29158 RepID=A0A8B6DSH4_MYTGA|nr:Hypothetical predicted protein [Mytilus galloprovincialis]